MIDKVTVVRRDSSYLGQAAEAVLLAQTPRDWKRASIDVIPREGSKAPARPFLHRGAWLDDGQGALWTVITALLNEENDRGDSYLWHSYEAVEGTHYIA